MEKAVLNPDLQKIASEIGLPARFEERQQEFINRNEQFIELLGKFGKIRGYFDHPQCHIYEIAHHKGGLTTFDLLRETYYEALRTEEGFKSFCRQVEAKLTRAN